MRIDSNEVLNKWKEFTLVNDQGMEVSILNFGGIITKIIAPDQDGAMENVVLAYKNYEDYEDNPNFLGATVGRVAGRIQDASFILDGETFSLEKNEKENHIHGGSEGFHHMIWDSKTTKSDNIVSLTLSLHSSDGTGGYPGNLDLSVTYSLNNNNDFKIQYDAKSDKKTALALTNHTYFNLSGNQTKLIHNHFITMNSDKIVELDDALIPTGKILDVDNTPFDFTDGQLLAEGIEKTHEQLKIGTNGYDHFFIFKDENEGNIKMVDDLSGRTLAIKTNQPGVVMYSSSCLDEGMTLAHGQSKPYLGVCFETQGSPASLHHDGFPTIILEANQPYSKYTEFSFSTKTVI